MKIRDVLDDARMLIAEFANPVSKVEQRITGLGDPLIDHLVKVLKWDDGDNLNEHPAGG